MIHRKFTRGDTLVPLYATLQDGAGNAVDLNNQTVKFYMQHTETDVMKIDGENAEIVTEASGEVLYSWKDADVDTVGKYWAWFVRFYGARRGTHPVNEQLLIEFVDGPVDT